MSEKRPLDSIPNSMMPSGQNNYDGETAAMLRDLRDDNAPQAGNDQEQVDQYQEVNNNNNYNNESYYQEEQNPTNPTGQYYRNTSTHDQMYNEDENDEQGMEQFQEYYPAPQKSMAQRLGDIVKVDGVLMVLFFFLSLPIVNQVLLRFIPRLGIDGRMGILGLLTKTLVFGLVTFVLFFFDLV